MPIALSSRLAVVAFALALLVCAIAPWAHVPAPAESLLALTVGAPELSVWLLAMAVAAALFAVIALAGDTRRRRLAQAALLFAVIGGALPLAVLVQVPSHARELDQQWREAFPSEPGTHTRANAYTWREMFAGLDVPSVKSIRGIPMAAPGGVALTVNVHRPDDERVLPIVVQIYGGGWRNGTPANNETLARALAANGFVVFAIDYRHTPTWRWPTQLDDVVAGVRWATDNARTYNADATRMGLIGRSAGAQLAMRASQDDRLPGVDAVVTLYGPVDLVEGHRSPPDPDPLDVRRVEEALFGATPDERMDAYVDASPITRADQPHPPTLVITAGRDHIVEPRFGALLHERLARSGVSFLLSIPWADHAFDAVSFGPSSQIALHYTQRFFALTLR